MPTPSAPLSLHLASTHLPEAVAVTLTLAPTGDRATNQLLLHPGKRGEIAVHLENHSDHPLHWQLEVKGDFRVTGVTGRLSSPYCGLETRSIGQWGLMCPLIF
ncbi:MAG: hypothetical protein HC881_04025 [Leptolyngbyaceae cyanobacterium SL_7_1]|nr:hypothetical protein [Leptolyngbyaceae cyanobacterium SL_7_1]